MEAQPGDQTDTPVLYLCERDQVSKHGCMSSTRLAIGSLPCDPAQLKALHFLLTTVKEGLCEIFNLILYAFRHATDSSHCTTLSLTLYLHCCIQMNQNPDAQLAKQDIMLYTHLHTLNKSSILNKTRI